MSKPIRKINKILKNSRIKKNMHKLFINPCITYHSFVKLKKIFMLNNNYSKM